MQIRSDDFIEPIAVMTYMALLYEYQQQNRKEKYYSDLQIIQVNNK